MDEPLNPNDSRLEGLVTLARQPEFELLGKWPRIWLSGVRAKQRLHPGVANASAMPSVNEVCRLATLCIFSLNLATPSLLEQAYSGIDAHPLIIRRGEAD